MHALSTHRQYFLIAGFYLVIGFMLVSLFPRGEIELAAYQLHTPFLSIIFNAFTYLGDGLFLILLLPVLLIFTTPKTTVEVGLSVVFTFAVIHVLKHYVFPEYDRPLRFFGDLVKTFRIEGMEENHHNSFPSGHSGQSMAIATALIFTFKKRSIHLVLLVLAILTGWSRVYLMQHFLVDTLVGASIALLMSLLVVTFLQKNLKGDFWNRRIFIKHKDTETRS